MMSFLTKLFMGSERGTNLSVSRRFCQNIKLIARQNFLFLTFGLKKSKKVSEKISEETSVLNQ